MKRNNPNIPGVEWVSGAGRFITIRTSLCTGCGDCVKVCLGECFEIKNQKAKIKSLAACMECASCWYVCQSGAVNFRWPKGGTGFRTRWG